MSRQFDIFLGFSQIEVDGYLPTEREMWDHLCRQAVLADTLGFGTLWVGGAHLSLADQQRHHATPVLPHFRGEVCLNTDILQLAPVIFGKTQRIAVGSALHSILSNGGPLAHAEALRTFLALQPLTPWAHRRLAFGFGAGRFDFVQAAYGIRPRTPAEAAAWPAIRGLVLREATEVFMRLVTGEGLASADLPARQVTRASMRSDADWAQVQRAMPTGTDALDVPPFWAFDRVRLIPIDSPLDTVTFYAGTTDLSVVNAANAVWPCRVFNLSNTPMTVIDRTHAHMSTAYHPGGGTWQRAYMPRTVLVFLDADPRRTPEAQRAVAAATAAAGVGAWQRAMEGTVDTRKLQEGMANAVYGNPDDVARQIHERFHPDDTLMVWFDFNDHDSGRVEQRMHDFMTSVVPRVRALEAA